LCLKLVRNKSNKGTTVCGCCGEVGRTAVGCSCRGGRSHLCRKEVDKDPSTTEETPLAFLGRIKTMVRQNLDQEASSGAEEETDPNKEPRTPVNRAVRVAKAEKGANKIRPVESQRTETKTPAGSSSAAAGPAKNSSSSSSNSQPKDNEENWVLEMIGLRWRRLVLKVLEAKTVINKARLQTAYRKVTGIEHDWIDVDEKMEDWNNQQKRARG